MSALSFDELHCILSAASLTPAESANVRRVSKLWHTVLKKLTSERQEEMVTLFLQEQESYQQRMLLQLQNQQQHYQQQMKIQQAQLLGRLG